VPSSRNHRVSVSVILPTFNRLRYLPETVASVFAQSFKDWELVIADDGSDAKTQAYLATLNDPPRVRVIQLSHTGRPAVVRNAALREATGEYAAFIDSDDVWLPTKLGTQIASLRARADCGWGQTRFVLVKTDGSSAREMPAADGWILGQLLKTQTVIALPSVVASRALLEEVGKFDEDLTMCEDYDLWLRLAAHSRIDAVDEPLTIVRRHGEHYGNSLIAFQDSIRVHNKVLRSGTAGQYEAFIRNDRAKNSASLAHCYAAFGDRKSALRALLSYTPTTWRHPGWWVEALKAIVAACIPHEIGRALRGYKGRSH
jgi:glycosyltransferase involved in cell wall biosynthesis